MALKKPKTKIKNNKKQKNKNKTTTKKKNNNNNPPPPEICLKKKTNKQTNKNLKKRQQNLYVTRECCTPVCSRKGEKLAQWPYVEIVLMSHLFLDRGRDED